MIDPGCRDCQQLTGGCMRHAATFIITGPATIPASDLEICRHDLLRNRCEACLRAEGKFPCKGRLGRTFLASAPGTPEPATTPDTGETR